MANQMGKRYVCAHCPTQLLVVKPGAGALECHGAPMTIEVPKPFRPPITRPSRDTARRAHHSCT